MKRFYLIFALFILISCSISNNAQLPKFSYNNKYYNSLIKNRVPEYGNGERDGCMPMAEIYLSLKSENQKEFRGEIKDVRSLEPISYASIQIFTNNSDTPIQLMSDINGHFDLTRQSGISRLTISTVGYRTLILDFSQSRIL